jgi:RNA-directed DNA polymerase
MFSAGLQGKQFVSSIAPALSFCVPLCLPLLRSHNNLAFQGQFLLHRKTRGDRMRSKLRDIKAELRRVHALANPRTGKMAGPGRKGTLRILCSSYQCSGAIRVPILCDRPMAMHATATKPTARSHMGPHDESSQRLATSNPHPPSVAKPALRRQAPEVGAVCGNPARTDLCGGRSVTSVPTANSFRLTCDFCAAA